MIQHFTRGPTGLVRRLNDIVDEVNKFSRIIGDDIVQVQRSSVGTTISLRRDKLASLVPKIGLRSQGLSSGLVAWYLFNNNSAKDSSGNDNDGTLTGTAAVSQDCYVGDSSADCYMRLATADMNATKGTVTAWAKTNTIAAGQDNIFGHYNSGHRIYINRVAAKFNIRLGDSATVDCGDSFVAGVWALVGLTWNDGTYYAYWNGEQTATGSYVTLTSLQTYAVVGNATNTAGNYNWDGMIDDVRIYNRDLSAEGHRQIYEEGNKRYSHKNERYGPGAIWRARTTEAAPAATNITCNLILNDGAEAASGEYGYEIEVYCDVCGGGNLNSALPRLADDDYLSVYQSWHTDGTLRWYAGTTFQTSEDCVCS